MLNNDMRVQKAKQINEVTRYFFNDNKAWIVEAVCPEWNGDKDALGIMWDNETYLLHKSNKIYWKGDFFDMDEETKKFTKRLYRDFQHAKQSKLYNIWFGAKVWIILGLLWILAGAACISCEIMQRRMEQQDADKKKQVVQPKTNTSLSIDFLDAKRQIQRYCAGLVTNKKY